MNSPLLFLLIFIFSVMAYSHQPSRGAVTAAFGPYVHQTFNNPPPLVGLGVLGEMDFTDYGGIEAGFFYFLKTYSRNVGNYKITEQVRKLNIPVGYRYWFSKKFSMGLFFNSLFSNGDYQTISSNIVTMDYTLARDIPEYGFEYSVQWEPWQSGKYGLLFDGRYFYSISYHPGEEAHQFSLFVALKYSVH